MLIACHLRPREPTTRVWAVQCNKTVEGLWSCQRYTQEQASYGIVSAAVQLGTAYMKYLSLRVVFHALLFYISHELPGVVSDNFMRSSCGTVTGEINERAGNSPSASSSMPLNTYDEFSTDSRDQCSASRPLHLNLQHIERDACCGSACTQCSSPRA